MEWDKKPPTLKEFAEVFNVYVDDVGVLYGDNPDGWIGSHKIVGDIRVYIDDDNDDTALEIIGLDLEQLGGCGCSSGITIRVKKV